VSLLFISEMTVCNCAGGGDRIGEIQSFLLVSGVAVL